MQRSPKGRSPSAVRTTQVSRESLTSLDSTTSTQSIPLPNRHKTNSIPGNGPQLADALGRHRQENPEIPYPIWLVDSTHHGETLSRKDLTAALNAAGWSRFETCPAAFSTIFCAP